MPFDDFHPQRHSGAAILAAVVCCQLMPELRAQDDVTFTPLSRKAQIESIFAEHCNNCHGDDEAAAGLNISSLKPDFSDGATLETWRMIEEQVRFQDMPPKEATPLPVDDRKAVLSWIHQQALNSQQPGRISDEKLHLPRFGNYVAHDALFAKRLSHVTPAPPRIWRLRPDIYRTVMSRLGERISGLSNALNETDAAGFRDYSAPLFLDEAATLQLLANAKTVARSMIGQFSRDRVLKQLDASRESPDDGMVAAGIETTFRRALGRAPVADEEARFLAFFRRSEHGSDPETAAHAMVTAVLLQPEFMFRHELGEGEPDRFGRVQLAPRELAFALSYALADLPIDEFLNAAESSELESAAEVADVVRQRLEVGTPNDNRNPRVIQFFREYFHYPHATEVFKDQPQGGTHRPDWLVADLEMTIKAILRRDHNVLAELLTTSAFHVDVMYGRKKLANTLVQRSGPKRDHYHTAFNLPPDWKWSPHLQPVSFPPDERAGVLTHPAWLAAWSGNFENHPVQRGKWIRTHLLGGTVPDVPIGVDARVPEMEHTTLRDRLKAATTATKCWRCHRKMDPLGVPFERYDHYGRLQRIDAGQPVDTSGRIDRSDFPELHGTVQGPAEMMQRLARSEHVEQVFVRHVFRYFLGRNETPGDANTLQDAHEAYRHSKGSFNELIVSLLSSDSFRLRQKEIRP